MKWQAIADITSQLNEEAKGYLKRKLIQEAEVIIPNMWSDFVSDTTSHLNEAQTAINVTTDENTGSLTCSLHFKIHIKIIKKPISLL